MLETIIANQAKSKACIQVDKLSLKYNLIMERSGSYQNENIQSCGKRFHMMMSSNGNIFRVTGLLCKFYEPYSKRFRDSRLQAGDLCLKKVCNRTQWPVSPKSKLSRLVCSQLNWHQGAVSIRKTVLPGMAIPMLKIRRPNGRLIFNMEIAIRR